MEKNKTGEMPPRSDNPQLATDFFAMFKTYNVVKTVNFLTPSLDSFLFQTAFTEDFPVMLNPRKIYIALHLSFVAIENQQAKVTVSELNMQQSKEFFQLFNLTFVNFDGETPVYSRELIPVGILWKKKLFLRTKITRPYEGAEFREISFTFYTSESSDGDTK